MIPIEIVSHFARPLSLTIRLYANMLAGEKVTLVFLGLTYLVAPGVFMGLHVFVSFLQAYVFTVLTMMYVGGAYRSRRTLIIGFLTLSSVSARRPSARCRTTSWPRI